MSRRSPRRPGAAPIHRRRSKVRRRSPQLRARCIDSARRSCTPRPGKRVQREARGNGLGSSTDLHCKSDAAPDVRSTALTACRATPLAIDGDRRSVSYDGRPVPLTKTEFDLLAVLAETPGRVLTREQLVARVWGAHHALTERTVDSHIKAVRQKLGDAGAGGARSWRCAAWVSSSATRREPRRRRGPGVARRRRAARGARPRTAHAPCPPPASRCAPGSSSPSPARSSSGRSPRAATRSPSRRASPKESDPRGSPSRARPRRCASSARSPR